MPVPFYNLGLHLFHADASQQLQHLYDQAARFGNDIALGRVEVRSQERAGDNVQDTRETDNTVVESETRGAHSHHLKSKRRGEKEEEGEEERPEDPDGKGQMLDLSM